MKERDTHTLFLHWKMTSVMEKNTKQIMNKGIYVFGVYIPKDGDK